MKIVSGIVIKQRSFGDNDKFIDILCGDGIIEIPVRGVKKINSKNSAASQLFAYSKFCIDEKYNKIFLNSAEPIHIFYGLRQSLEKISLASYFADLLEYCIAEDTKNHEIMRLFLNTLYLLEKDTRSCDFLKSVFELRLVSEIGLMPDIVSCKKCGIFEPDEIYFNISESSFLCRDCRQQSANSDIIVKCPLSVLKALRHIVFSDFNRLFNFRISDNSQSILSYLSEQYIVSHFEHNFKTLDFYKSIKDMTI